MKTLNIGSFGGVDIIPHDHNNHTKKKIGIDAPEDICLWTGNVYSIHVYKIPPLPFDIHENATL